MVAGLEKHDELKGYIDKIERRKSERDTGDIKLQLGLCTEYIVDQFLKEYPLCVGADLYSNIVNLEGVLSEETVNLLHSLRIARNDGGAHRNEGKKISFEETIELYNKLLAYLPEFLNTFPTPSEKPAPPKSTSIGLGFEIDFESIQPLELHPNWRECIGYQDMLKFREMPQFEEYVQNIYTQHDDTEIFYWFWCVMLTDRLNLIIRNDGKEYLDIKKLVKYYYEALQKNKCDHWMQMPNGHEETYYIPAIIREYFPNDLARFCTGKGYEWRRYETLFGENWENRRYKTVSALVNGEIAVVKQAVTNEIHWHTVGKAEEERKQREAAVYRKAQAKKREEAREAARIAQEKKEYEERKARREKEQEEERQQLINKIKKSFVLIFAVVFAMYLITIVFHFIFGNGIIIQLVLIAAIVYFVIKRKNKKE